MHVNVGFNFFISKDFLKKKIYQRLYKGYIQLTYSKFQCAKKGGNYSQRF